MSEYTSTELFNTLEKAIAAQSDTVRQWHAAPPPPVPAPATTAPTDLLAEVLAQHRCNFELWHIEDEARRTDVGDDVIADCKRRIDPMNQSRNDGMERIDACIGQLIAPLMPANSADRVNTEPPGMVLDRLSILSLKIFHMAEQLERTDVAEAHLVACREKLETLSRQRAELAAALHALIEEYLAGSKRPHVYHQCKMYNDPSLNPKLYANKG